MDKRRLTLLLIYLAACAFISSAEVESCLDVFIIGGTGDLAKRYLWKAFFNLYQNQFHGSKDISKVRFYGTGRASTYVEDNAAACPFRKLLDDSIQCTYLENCEKSKKAFIDIAKYIQLKTDKQYEELCSNIQSNNCVSHEIIFYLSVPPFAYEGIMKNIGSYCDIQSANKSYKFVFEKPFGSDLESALSLSSMLQKYVKESQIFRIDHYLGKQTVSNILDFRKRNKDIDRMLNRKFVKRIEVVVKETVGAEGRISYYDQSGAIRDMLQSHLTEILSLLMMDFNRSNGRLEILKSVAPIQLSNMVLGQYSGYLLEVYNETGINKSSTPTFAAAHIKINTARWKSVPVLVTSGKRLDERIGYARVLFKRTSIQDIKLNDYCIEDIPQIIFYIGHGDLGTPAILVSKLLSLTPTYIPPGWEISLEFEDKRVFGTIGKCFRIFVPRRRSDAYTFLISQLHRGNKEYFVPLDGLLESWRIWSSVLDGGKTIKQYPVGSSMEDVLKFKMTKNGRVYTGRRYIPRTYLENLFLKQCNLRPHKITFLGHPAVTGSKRFIIEALANDIRQAVIKLNTDFHIALSGGSSPRALYDFLTRHMKNEFPWNKTHIWQVDERCSPEYSNFKMIEQYLINKIEIDPKKVHPMPVSFRGDECSKAAVDHYESEIMKLITPLGESSNFNYILLGMGGDGHTASLFPFSDILLDSTRHVAVGRATGSDIVSPRRMTITLKTINESDFVAILVTGEQKCEMLNILKDLEHCCTQQSFSHHFDLVRQYPVCGVSPRSGRLNWYIDDDALSCQFQDDM